MHNSYNPKSKSFKHTFCVFEQKSLNEISNLEIRFQSNSGSKYYYTHQGMYRFSNHWGRLANCKWRLTSQGVDLDSKFKLGFATWESFYPDNDDEELYYIDVDFDTKGVLYQHKNNPNYNNKSVLRTSKLTSKRIKQIRNLLELTSWAKHFECDDIQKLRSYIINELIYTNKTLDKIKLEANLCLK
jgi:hypothetical protein